MEYRLGLALKIFKASLLWCAGSWNLNVKQLENIRALEDKAFRTICKVARRQHDVLDEFYFARVHRVHNHLRELYKLPRWDLLVHQAHFSWAGHVARMGVWAPERLTYQILSWEKVETLRKGKAQYGTQGHQKRFKPWR